jgi:acyl dehydratase
MVDHLNKWNLYKEGKVIKWNFCFKKKHIKDFAKISGDHNPVHNNIIFAQSKGFKKPIIYGALLCTQVSRLIGQELPDNNCILVSINLDFLSPAHVNNKLNFYAKILTKSNSTHLLEFECYIKRSKKILCKGIVKALWIN